MTPKKLEESIVFRERVEDGINGTYRVVEAALPIYAEVRIPRDIEESVTQPNFWVDEAKKNLRRRIMSEIYDDQRRQMHVALMELFRVTTPYTFDEMQEVRGRILELARHMKPEEEK